MNGRPRCLVVGYDRSDAARRAAAWAARQAGSTGHVVVVHACGGPHLPALSTASERRCEADALMDELLLDGDPELLDAALDLEVSDDGPVDALTDAAQRYGADAIVVGNRRRSRLREAVGTVTAELLRRASVPVVAVPTPD
jgi:nucleotide-binding universal stress UspA family protein